MVVAAVAWYARRWEWRLRGDLPSRLYGTALIVALLLGSHVLLAALTADPSPPVGEQMLWPISAVWIHFYPLFERVDKVVG